MSITPPTLRMPLSAALLAAGAVLMTSLAPGAWAADQKDETPHVVQVGDTLEGLPQSYFGTPRLWHQLQARNKVKDPRQLQPGSVVWIPAGLLPAESAQVEFVHGDVKVHTAEPGASTNPAAAANPPVAAGTMLAEGTRLQVGPNGFVTVRLADGSIVKVSAQSDVQLRQLRRRGRAGSVQSVVEIQRGSVESSVAPGNDPSRRFEVRTPRAVTSVRGTRFGVALSESGHTTAAVLQGAVAVQSRTADNPAPHTATATVLQPGQGLAVQADGTVGSPRSLLPAPNLTSLPAAVHDLGLLALNVPAQTGASAYQAIVARDAELTQVLRSGTFANGQLRWKGLDDGQYFISVRAIDAAGIAGACPPPSHSLLKPSQYRRCTKSLRPTAWFPTRGGSCCVPRWLACAGTASRWRPRRISTLRCSMKADWTAARCPSPSCPWAVTSGAQPVCANCRGAG